MLKKTLAVWDLGATKCAAAIIDFDVHTDRFECLSSCRLTLTNYDSLNALVTAVETALNFALVDADVICIGAAGRFDGKEIQLSAGYPFPMTFGEEIQKKRWRRISIVHDYIPVACATLTNYLANPDHIETLVAGESKSFGRRLVMGVGTGLGLKDLIVLPDGRFWLGENEAGHIGVCLPPQVNAKMLKRHNDFMCFLRQCELGQDASVSFEKILSGKGLSRMHQFLTQGAFMDPALIGADIQAGQHADTVAMCAWYLGLYIGTIQLLFLPSGGIWLTGGVLLKNPAIYRHDALMAGIAASPAYQAERALFPLHVIKGEQYALMGGAYYAAKRLLC